jgi:GntR family transcriptional regulator, transcriptional repressor for pyruvate dehydrogenase complex
MITPAPARALFQAIPRSKVYQEIARQLRRHITEQLNPGELLPSERDLARMLRVSRSSVRDAVHTLEMMGLLEPRQGIGTVVCTPGAASENPLADALLAKRKTIADLLEVRNMIEPFLARRAAQRISSDEIANMEDILLRQQVKVRAGELGIDEDSQFHYAIAMASDNVAILKVVDVLMDLLRETRERTLQVRGRQQKSLSGHRRILAAVKRGDASAAEAAMRRHLREIEEVVLRKL